MEVKQKRIEDKEGELQATLKGLNDLNASIEVLGREIEESYNGLTVPSLSGQDFSVIKDYLAYLDQRRIDLMEEKERMQGKMNVLKAELVDLLKELKMLEALESKTLQAIKKSENRREQKKLDQIALRLEERRL